MVPTSRVATLGCLTLTGFIVLVSGCGTSADRESTNHERNSAGLRIAKGPAAASAVEWYSVSSQLPIVKARLTIPADSVDSPSEFRIERRGLPPAAASRGVIDGIFISPSGTQFLRPAELTLYYDEDAVLRSGAIGSRWLNVASYSPETRKWETVPIKRRDEYGCGTQMLIDSCTGNLVCDDGACVAKPVPADGSPAVEHDEIDFGTREAHVEEEPPVADAGPSDIGSEASVQGRSSGGCATEGRAPPATWMLLLMLVIMPMVWRRH